MKKFQKNVFAVYMLVLALCIFPIIRSEAAVKYYSPISLGIHRESHYAIKSIKGNVLTYIKYKYGTDAHGEFCIVRSGSYKKAKVTPRTKYWVGNTRKLSATGNRYQSKYLHRVTRQEFFSGKTIWTQKEIRHSYLCQMCNTKFTIKNGKIARIVRYGFHGG